MPLSGPVGLEELDDLADGLSIDQRVQHRSG